MDEIKKRKLDSAEGVEEKLKHDNQIKPLENNNLFENIYKMNDKLVNFTAFPEIAVLDKADDDKFKLQAAEEKHLINLQSIKEHKKYIDKQKQKIEHLKERLKNYELNNEEKANNFTEVSKYHKTLQKRITDIKNQLNSVRQSVDDLKKSYYKIKFKTKFEIKQVEEMNEFIKTLQNKNNELEEELRRQSNKKNSVLKVYEQKIHSVELKISNLKKLIDDVNDTYKKEREAKLEFEHNLSQENSIYQNLVLQKNNKLKEVENMKEKLENDLKCKTKQLNILNSETKQLSTDLMHLHKTITENNEKINSLNKIIIEKDQKLQDRNTEFTKLQHNFNVKDEELQSMQSRLVISETKVIKLTEDLSKIMENNVENRNKIEELEDILMLKNEEFEKLSQEIKNQRNIQNENLVQIQKLEKDIQQFEINKEKIFIELNNEKQLQNSINKQLEQFVYKIQQLELEVKQKETENLNLIAEKETCTTEQKNKLEKLLVEVENLKKNVEDNNALVKVLTNDRNNLKTENRNLNNKCNEIEEKLRLAEETYEGMRERLDSSNEIHKKLQNELNNKKKELKSLRCNKINMEDSVLLFHLKYNERVNKLKEEAQNLREENEKLDALGLVNEIENIRKKLKNKEDDIEHLKKRTLLISASNVTVCTVEKGLKEVKKKLTCANDSLMKKNATLQKSQNELAKVEKKLNDTKLKADGLKKEAENLKKQCDILEEKIFKKSTSNIALKNEIREIKKESIIQRHRSFMMDAQQYMDGIKTNSQELVNDISNNSLNTLINSRILMPNSSKLSQQNEDVTSNVHNKSFSLLNEEKKEMYETNFIDEIKEQNKENDNVLTLLDEVVNISKKTDLQTDTDKNDKQIVNEKPDNENWNYLSCEEKFDLLLSQESPVKKSQENLSQKIKTENEHGLENVKTYFKLNKRKYMN